jgi:hypothetical protein
MKERRRGRFAQGTPELGPDRAQFECDLGTASGHDLQSVLPAVHHAPSVEKAEYNAAFQHCPGLTILCHYSGSGK